MNSDRVTELYLGEISSSRGQKICRRRIDWMVEQIRGDRVLDVGCSQGITSILAARGGASVVGIDGDPVVIEYARRALTSEPQDVQGRVRFLHADIHEIDLDGATFDTVLLGEIIEHLEEPRRLVERALGFLAPGGTVIVTTPFGHHPHDDHKVTFYLSSFHDVMEGLCVPVELTVADGFIRFVGRHRDVGEPAIDLGPAALLARSEEGFLAKELASYRVNADRKREMARSGAEIKRLSHRIEALAKDVLRRDAELERERQRAAAQSAQREAMREKLIQAQDRVAAARASARAARQRKMPEILPPPPGAGRVTRLLSALFGSMQHEIHVGRAFRRPHTAAFKTLYRARRALRAASAPVSIGPAPAVTAPTAAAPDPKRVVFPPFQALVHAQPSSLTIATILDTFSESCLRYEANLVPLSPRDWQRELEEHRPAFLLCESAWQGNQGQWRYLFTNYLTRPENPLRDLLAWCKAQGIPRVFWNKEDPSNFDVFKDVAADFDVVFTTDQDCIPRYQELLGHDRIHALPFAAQPAVHNPIRDGVRQAGNVCFAGSWRARKYPNRATDSEILLQPAIELGLDIFDRNAGTGNEELAFPPPYADAVRGSLDYDSMLTAYRSYRTFLNVNSVKDSPTMCARRVFELMACGTPVVTSDSVAIRTMLGSLVKIATTPEETRGHLVRLLEDAPYRDRFAHAGYREVLSRHTYHRRLNDILRALGMEPAGAAPPRITILAATNRPDRLPNLLDSVRRQVHPDVELIILLNSDRFDPDEVEKAAADLPRVRVFHLPESYTLAECLNHGLEHATGDWIAKFDDDDLYGPHYLSDLLLATRYTDAAILGKRSCFCWLEASRQLVRRFPEHVHRHVEFVTGASLFVRRDVFDQVKFSPVVRGTDTVFQQECRSLGMRVYASDPYNFVVVRQANPAAHTWAITDDAVLRRAVPVAEELDLGLVMI